MAAANEKKKTENLSLNQQLSDFLQKNRKPFFIGIIAIAVILAGIIIMSSVNEKILSNALSKVDAFNRKYEELKPYIGSSDPDAVAKQIDVIILMEEVSKFAEKQSGYAAARAYSISAVIYHDQKNWSLAEEAWAKAAKEAGKTYLAPVSLYNAAVAAEEQGNIESSIDYYKKAMEYGNIFPQAARAQFSVGRLEESRNNKDEAIAAYRSLLSKWPDDPVWPNLAHNRLLVLTD